MSKTHPLRTILEFQRELFGDNLFIPKIEFVVNEKPLAEMPKNEPSSVAEPVTFYDQNSKKPVDEMKKKIWQQSTTLEELETLISGCLNCQLGKTRNRFVFGKGNPNADILLIGEGPGAEEDLKGEPFVGRAGQLLTDILKAINLTREEVYIANIVKCRPHQNRAPFPEEIDCCLPYLNKQIELISPKLILCLGATAVFGLLKRKEALGKLRGEIYEYGNRKVMVTYHPAALLRNPALKRGCWEDVQKFRALYDEIKNKAVR